MDKWLRQNWLSPQSQKGPGQLEPSRESKLPAGIGASAGGSRHLLHPSALWPLRSPVQGERN